MKHIICSLLTAALLACPGILRAQDPFRSLDRFYGPDQSLYNGKKYTYAAPSGTTGHPFLLSSLYVHGSVTIKGRSYDSIMVNYDVFNQVLVFRYADETSPWNKIEISRAWLTSFRLADKNFELLTIEKEPQFYQVLGEGTVRILYFWRKTLNLNDVIGSTNYVFSKPLRDAFVYHDGLLKPFTSRGTLIRNFDRSKKQVIKSYLRKHKIRVSKASDREMADLITFIGNLP